MSEVTEALYESDPYAREFEARVLSEAEDEGGRYVVLDRTAFYPGGGGQPPDRGTLNGIAVRDARRADDAITRTLRK